MNFLRALGGYVDGLWSLLTFPLLFIFGNYIIYYFPIPTFIITFLIIRIYFIFADLSERNFHLTGDKECKRAKHYNLFVGIILSIATLSAYYFWVKMTLKYDLCRDYSIPFTLPELLRYIAPNKC